MCFKKYMASVSECLKETEQVFSKHRRAIHVAVDQVLERLVQLTHLISENQI